MKGLRNISIWEFLNNIQSRAKENVAMINRNNQKIEEYKTLLRDDGIETNGLINRLENENKELFADNSLLLSLHQKILALGEKLKATANGKIDDSPEVNSNNDMYQPTTEECVSLVVDGMLKVTDEHGCFCNEETINAIYEALVALERYEECSILLKLKERYIVNK